MGGCAANRRVFLQDVVAEVEVMDQSLRSAAQLRVSAKSYFFVADADSFANLAPSALWARARLTRMRLQFSDTLFQDTFLKHMSSYSNTSRHILVLLRLSKRLHC